MSRNGTQVEVDDHEEIVSRVAAIDVAKATGMVCTRAPDDHRPDRRVSTVWEVNATTNAITSLADHLVCQGVERVVVESTSDYVRSEGEGPSPRHTSRYPCALEAIEMECATAYRFAAVRPALISPAAARTRPSNWSCTAAGARTSGEGTERAARMPLLSRTAAAAAHTPSSISSSLVAHPR